MSPKKTLWVAWAMLIFSIISWPLASFVFAKDEPQFVIALSELALIYTAFDAIQTSKVSKKQENENNGSSSL